MKTLLVYPRFSPFSSPPLGLAYIAANMREQGLDIDLLDGTFKTIDSVIEKVRSYRPDIIAFSLMTQNLVGLKGIIKQIREFDGEIRIVAGGPHPSILPTETMEDYDIDIVVVGEGEHTMVDLVNCMESGKPLKDVKGIYYKDGGKIRNTGPRFPIEDLDDIPFPARDLLEMDKYIKASLGRSSWSVPRPSATVMASRGCPYGCTFCAARFIHGRKIRKRSPKRIVDEIEELVKTYRLKGIWFNDDSFTVDLKWITELMKEMKDRDLKIGFGCNTRVNHIDLDIMRELKDAGCRFIAFGVESGVQRVLDEYLKKGINTEQIEKAFRMVTKVGVTTQAYFMVGIPGETMADMHRSIEFAKKLNPDAIHVSIATPLPGTEFSELAEEMGEMEIKDWEKLDYMWEGVIRTKEFSPEMVRKMQRKFLFKFYMRPGYFITQMGRIRSFQDLITRVRGAYQLFGRDVSPLSLLRRKAS